MTSTSSDTFDLFTIAYTRAKSRHWYLGLDSHHHWYASSTRIDGSLWAIDLGHYDIEPSREGYDFILELVGGRS
jgi:hypothetical protein